MRPGKASCDEKRAVQTVLDKLSCVESVPSLSIPPAGGDCDILDTPNTFGSLDKFFEEMGSLAENFLDELTPRSLASTAFYSPRQALEVANAQ